MRARNITAWILGIFWLLASQSTFAETATPKESVLQNATPEKITRKVDVTPDETQKTVDAVVADARYGKTETVTRWKPKKDIEKDAKDDDEEESFLEKFLKWLLGDDDKDDVKDTPKRDKLGVGMAQGAELIMWIFFAVLAVFILTQLGKWAGWLGTAQTGRKRAAYEQPTEMFGLALDKESLPMDVVDEAKALLAQGNMRAAVALLYRASLIKLIHEQGIEISASSTEYECQQLVARTQSASLSQVFNQLTTVWLQVAYDKGNPTEEAVYAVCDAWRPAFGSPTKQSAHQDAHNATSETTSGGGEAS